MISDDEDDDDVRSSGIAKDKNSRRACGVKRARREDEKEGGAIVDCDHGDMSVSTAGADNEQNKVISVSISDADGMARSSTMRSGGVEGNSFFPSPSATSAAATTSGDDQPKLKEHRKEKQIVQKEAQQNKKLSIRTQLVDAVNPHRGAFSICKLPISDLLTPAALQQMLALCPTRRGQVKMLGKVIDTPRYFQMYLHSYNFTGLVHAAEAELPNIFQPILDWLNSEAYVEATAGGRQQLKKGEDYPQQQQERHKFNGVLVNWYMDGSDYIGPHADSTSQLHPRSDIVTVSFGASRVFRIRGPSSAFSLIPSLSSVNSNKKGSSAANNAILHDIAVRNGDVLVMHGAFQEHYKHEIVKITGAAALAATGPRISVTFRQYK